MALLPGPPLVPPPVLLLPLLLHAANGGDR
jgi:hypothetical protein